MKTILVEVTCQKCGRPGKVEVDPSMPEVERWLKMYTCDPCMIVLGRMKPKQSRQGELEETRFADP
jgi:RecJ-like exonuclease